LARVAAAAAAAAATLVSAAAAAEAAAMRLFKASRFSVRPVTRRSPTATISGASAGAVPSLK
jgi:hypothetical protein